MKSRSLMAFIVYAAILVSCKFSPVQVLSTDTPTMSTILKTDNFSELSYWIPGIESTFQIQLSNYPPDINQDADIFELDLFETPPETIRTLHSNGKKVICYFNAGAWEEYRPDADMFPQEVIGKPYIGWPGEKWLDISRFETFSHIMERRMDLAVEKGCDGIDPDNVNGFLQPTGFKISAQDQLNYNMWLSQQAHLRGLSIGLKNNGSQVSSLVNFFDFAVIEDCAYYDECGQFLPFSEQGKIIFQIEYIDHYSEVNDLCHKKINNSFSILLKQRDLNEFVDYCP